MSLLEGKAIRCEETIELKNLGMRTLFDLVDSLTKKVTLKAYP